MAVPAPLPSGRRPDWLAPPRWPTWDAVGVLAAVVVLGPAVWQLAYRLLQAMLDTSVLLGADPTRADHLHAAGGVAGGGITAALAVAALAVARGRPGYLGAAAGVVGTFCVFPFIAYTANAGVVSAPVPPLAEMIAPPRWEMHAQLVAAFWLAALSLVAAVGDLVIRSVRRQLGPPEG